MSSRHTRRKAAKAKAEAKTLAMAVASRSADIARVVRANKAAPIERNYYAPSPMGSLTSKAHRGYVCQNKLRVVVKQ